MSVEASSGHRLPVQAEGNVGDVTFKLHTHSFAQPVVLAKPVDACFPQYLIGERTSELVVGVPGVPAFKGKRFHQTLAYAVAYLRAAAGCEHTAVQQAESIHKLPSPQRVLLRIIIYDKELVALVALQRRQRTAVLPSRIHIQQHQMELPVGQRAVTLHIVLVDDPVVGTDISDCRPVVGVFIYIYQLAQALISCRIGSVARLPVPFVEGITCTACLHVAV